LNPNKETFLHSSGPLLWTTLPPMSIKRVPGHCRCYISWVMALTTYPTMCRDKRKNTAMHLLNLCAFMAGYGVNLTFLVLNFGFY